MSALSFMGNPNQRGYRPKNTRMRRLENVPAPAQAGSTTTIHDVSYLGFPDYNLARDYNLSLENNFARAIDAKRLEHAAVWATLRGILVDPPPPYTKHAEFEHDIDPRRARAGWERGMAHRQAILDQMWVCSRLKGSSMLTRQDRGIACGARCSDAGSFVLHSAPSHAKRRSTTSS